MGQVSGVRLLLDTNVVIGYLDGREPVRQLMERHDAVPAISAISQISRIELLSFHALSKDDEHRILALLSAVQVILIDEGIERETIALRRRTRLKLPDAVIAATARVNGLELLTLDERLNAAWAAG